MDSSILNNKIKTCVIGNGEWAQQVGSVLGLISRYDFLGHIDTKTNTETKQALIDKSDLLYIAVPAEFQKEYIELGIKLKKHIICESPILTSPQERKEIYNLLIENAKNNKIFYCNFPYFLDQDFAKIISGGLIRKVKFISVKCMGPKFKDDPENAKKFYINQAFNLILNISTVTDIKNFEIFTINDDFCGELHAGNKTFLFQWDYNHYPKLDISIKGDDYSKSAELIYDKYDQIMPLLINLSDKILNIDDDKLSPMFSKETLDQYGENLISKLSISSYLISSTAEYFSDIFVKSSGKKAEIIDPSKLFINGGFYDVDYSILKI